LRRNESLATVSAVPGTLAEAERFPWLVRPMQPLQPEAGLAAIQVLDMLDALEALGRK